MAPETAARQSDRTFLLAGVSEAGPGRVRLVFRLSERSVVTAAVGRRRVSKRLDAGARSITVTRLRRGRRTATLAARDGRCNNSATARRSFRVR